jgi:hypothetical protein
MNMKRKGSPRRVLTVVSILVVCGILIAIGCGCTGYWGGFGGKQSCQHHSQYQYNHCGDGNDCGGYSQCSQCQYNHCGDSYDCGCQPSYYIYYYSGSTKCGQSGSCSPIEKPERPDCSTIAVPTTDVTPSIPELDIPELPTITPVIPTIPDIPSVPTIP